MRSSSAALSEAAGASAAAAHCCMVLLQQATGPSVSRTAHTARYVQHAAALYLLQRAMLKLG
jgi:hypothetical protein